MYVYVNSFDGGMVIPAMTSFLLRCDLTHPGPSSVQTPLNWSISSLVALWMPQPSLSLSSSSPFWSLLPRGQRELSSLVLREGAEAFHCESC